MTPVHSENAFSVRGARVVVVGAARSGLAAAGLLRDRGADVTLSERRPEVDSPVDALRETGVRVETGEHRAETFELADLVVLSPGVPSDLVELAAARRRGIPVISEIELASRWLKGPVVAVTGTKGKSTTTTLVGRMLAEGGLRVLVGGNIGTPLSAQVPLSSTETVHVVEVSSFQLEGTVRFRPAIAVLLNLTTDHLDRHGSMEAYREAKGRIFANQEPSDWAVINADDPDVLALAARGRARRLHFGRHLETEGVTVEAGTIVRRQDGRGVALVPLSAIRLLGSHQTDDVMAAAGVSSILGVDADALTRAVRSFAGLEHALERVAEHRGVTFVNDSKATNVDAARRAIEAFANDLVVIMGGRFKGGDLGSLRGPLSARAGRVVAIGEARHALRQALGPLVVAEAASIEEAVDIAYRLAGRTGTVLLAPACASFDMFADYADRGRRFKAAVAGLSAAGEEAPRSER